MAGRGTDIVLGGNVKFEVQKEIYDYLLILKKDKKIIKNNSKISKILENKTVISDEIKKIFLFLLKNEEFLKINPLELLKLLNEIEKLETTNNEYKKT